MEGASLVKSMWVFLGSSSFLHVAAPLISWRQGCQCWHTSVRMSVCVPISQLCEYSVLMCVLCMYVCTCGCICPREQASSAVALFSCETPMEH